MKKKKKNCFLSRYSIKWWDSPEFKKILIQVLMRKKRHLVHLLSAPVRYIKLKVKSVYKKLVKETDNEYIMKKSWKKSQ